MDKRAEFKLRSYVIAIIVFSSIISLAYLMVYTSADKYDNTEILDPEFQENFARLNNQTTLINNFWNATNSADGLTLLDVGDIFLRGTFTVISLTFGSLLDFAVQIKNIGNTFGIDDRVMTILFSIFLLTLTASVIIIIINAINKTDRF